MEPIPASSVYDRETFRALNYIAIYRKRRPGRTLALRLLIWLPFIAFFVWDLLREQLPGESRTVSIVCLAVIAAEILFTLYMHFLQPVRRYRAHGKLAGAENRFLFGETEFHAKTVGSASETEADVRYEMLWRVYETDARLFLYINKLSAYVVDKSTVPPERMDELRGRLASSSATRYIRCRY